MKGLKKRGFVMGFWLSLSKHTCWEFGNGRIKCGTVTLQICVLIVMS